MGRGVVVYRRKENAYGTGRGERKRKGEGYIKGRKDGMIKEREEGRRIKSI